MKKYKVTSILLIVAIIFTLVFPVNVFASEVVTSLEREYTSEYFEKIAKVSVQLGEEKSLKSLDNAERFIVFDILGESPGYAIVDKYKLCVVEYSLYAESPYQNIDEKNIYYEIPCGYYTKENNKYMHIYSGESLPITTSLNTLNYDIAMTEADKLMKFSNLSQANDVSRSVTYSNNLPYSLSTSWINGFCGPTTAYIMMNYRSLIPYQPEFTPQMHIQQISTFTNQNVTLASLTAGMNQYLYVNNAFPRVASMGYSFAKVMSEIDSGRPLSLGTPGHVQTIHGYSRDNMGSIEYYTLYTNNSWGQNNIAISYEGGAPSNLVDHVYFIS